MILRHFFSIRDNAPFNIKAHEVRTEDEHKLLKALKTIRIYIKEIPPLKLL